MSQQKPNTPAAGGANPNPHETSPQEDKKPALTGLALETVYNEVLAVAAELHETQSQLVAKLEDIRATNNQKPVVLPTTPADVVVTGASNALRQVQLEQALQASRGMQFSLTFIESRFTQLWALLGAVDEGVGGPVNFSDQVAFLIQFKDVGLPKIKTDLEALKAVVSASS